MISLVNRLLSYFPSKSKLLIINRFPPIAKLIIFIDSKDYSLIFIINFPLSFFFSNIGFKGVVINIVIIFNRIDSKRDIINIAIIFNIKYFFFSTGVFGITVRKINILTFYLT